MTGALWRRSWTLADLAAMTRDTLVDHLAFGPDINAKHCRSVRAGDTVRAVARPLHVGHQTHVWEIRIDEAQDGKLVCIARLTTAIKPLFEKNGRKAA